MPQKREVVQLGYEPAGDKHIAFHDAWKDYNVRIFCGAWGSGKSRAAAYEVVSQLLENPLYIGKTALVVGMTTHHCENQLWEQNFKKILQWTDKKGRQRGLIEGVHFKLTKKPQMKVEFSNGSTILFASLEAKQNLAGFSVSIVFADELDKTDIEWWNLIQSRARGESERNIIFATCNPQNKSHWLYKRYVENYEKGIPNEGVWYGTVTIDDNKFLSDQDKQDAKNRYAYSAHEYRKAILGEWISTDGLVYSQFDRDKHSYDSSQVNIGIEWPKWAGLDFGYNDATAGVYVARNPENNAYYVYREYYESGRTPEINAKHLKQKTRTGDNPAYFVSDHYTETVETYRNQGLNIKLADKGKGSIMAGISIVQQLLFQNRLYIDRSCINLIRELETYQWDQKTGEPKKHQSDHALDAIRYVMFDLEAHGEFFALAPEQFTKIEVDENNNYPISTGRESSAFEVPEGCIVFAYEQDGSPIFARVS